MENQIMKSKNRGLILNLLEEIKKYPFSLKVEVIYRNGLILKGVLYEKNWKEVYFK